MFDITLSYDLTVNIDGTSEGTQTKFYDKGYWYKTDTFEEGIVEYLVSKLLTFSTLPKKSYVVYEYGKINGKSGCRSKDFLKPGYELITFERIHQYFCFMQTQPAYFLQFGQLLYRFPSCRKMKFLFRVLPELKY